MRAEAGAVVRAVYVRAHPHGGWRPCVARVHTPDTTDEFYKKILRITSHTTQEVFLIFLAVTFLAVTSLSSA